MLRVMAAAVWTLWFSSAQAGEPLVNTCSYVESGVCPPINAIQGIGGTASYIGNLTTLPVEKPRCPPGWTKVYIATIRDGLSVPKCAAVGDLRDPE